MKWDRIRTVIGLELTIAIRDGEQLLLALGLPVVFLVFFTQVDVLPTAGRDSVDFLAPGILALALLSVSFVRLAIALGFDRAFGAIRRLAVTPLRVGEYVAAKIMSTAILFAAQCLILVAIAVALGWRPHLHWAIIPALVLAMAAFCGLGLALSSVCTGLTALAVANALYVLMLMLSGIVVPLEDLPGPGEQLMSVLPSAALSTVLRSTLEGSAGSLGPWLVLLVWAVLSPLLAAWLFRWE